MKVEEFTRQLRSYGPQRLVELLLDSEDIAACSSKDYKVFRDFFSSKFSGVQDVRIMGSGNWGFSLNPIKLFRPFNLNSDIDTVIISDEEFHSTWDELRKYHRNYWYGLSNEQRNSLRRNGENVYSGFISPLWIPHKGNRIRFRFISLISKSPDYLVGRRVIKAVIFRNREEVIDYYKRSIITLR